MLALYTAFSNLYEKLLVVMTYLGLGSSVLIVVG